VRHASTAKMESGLSDMPNYSRPLRTPRRVRAGALAVRGEVRNDRVEAGPFVRVLGPAPRHEVAPVGVAVRGELGPELVRRDENSGVHWGDSRKGNFSCDELPEHCAHGLEKGRKKRREGKEKGKERGKEVGSTRREFRRSLAGFPKREFFL
jgi:hypothetical protein